MTETTGRFHLSKDRRSLAQTKTKKRQLRTEGQLARTPDQRMKDRRENEEWTAASSFGDAEEQLFFAGFFRPEGNSLEGLVILLLHERMRKHEEKERETEKALTARWGAVQEGAKKERNERKQRIPGRERGCRRIAPPLLCRNRPPFSFPTDKISTR